uniref:Uncharacterized protein n=1 Tax=Leersia perrieri TaxID=77586 RepID=A0A0D9XB75_9ORYZ
MLTCGTDHLCALTLTPSSPTFIHPHSPFHSHPQRKPNATPSTDGRRRSEEPQRGIEQSRAWASELAGRTAGKLAGDRGGARGCGTERGSGTRSDWRACCKQWQSCCPIYPFEKILEQLRNSIACATSYTGLCSTTTPRIAGTDYSPGTSQQNVSI